MVGWIQYVGQSKYVKYNLEHTGLSVCPHVGLSVGPY